MVNFLVLLLLGILGIVLSRFVFKYIFGGLAVTTLLVGLGLMFAFSVMPVGVKEVVKEAVPKKVKDKVDDVFDGAGEVACKVNVLVFGKADTYWERGMSYLGVKVDGGISYVGKRLVDAIFSPGFLIFVICFGYLKWKGYINFAPTVVIQAKK